MSIHSIHRLIFSLQGKPLFLPKNNPPQKSLVIDLLLYRHALWQLQEVIVITSCHIVMELWWFISHVDIISSTYMDLLTYYILTVQKIFIDILSSILHIIILPTCLSISFTKLYHVKQIRKTNPTMIIQHVRFIMSTLQTISNT